jgi:hypothetical protein
MRRSQSNIIEFAARLVRCRDDTPAEEVKIRCESANVIKDCYDEIHRLQAIVDKVQAELVGFEQLDDTEGFYDTLHDIHNIVSIAAAEAAKGE